MGSGLDQYSTLKSLMLLKSSDWISPFLTIQLWKIIWTKQMKRCRKKNGQQEGPLESSHDIKLLPHFMTRFSTIIFNRTADWESEAWCIRVQQVLHPTAVRSKKRRYSFQAEKPTPIIIRQHAFDSDCFMVEDYHFQYGFMGRGWMWSKLKIGIRYMRTVISLWRAPHTLWDNIHLYAT